MNIIKVYFQIQTTYKAWNEITAFEAVFSSKEEALDLAQKTAELWRCQVRVCDNELLTMSPNSLPGIEVFSFHYRTVY